MQYQITTKGFYAEKFKTGEPIDIFLRYSDLRTGFGQPNLYMNQLTEGSYAAKIYDS